jgi:nucleoid-associated protein YgaU
MALCVRLALIASISLALIGCGDLFEPRTAGRPRIGDAPSPITGGPPWGDSPMTGPTVYIVTPSDSDFEDIARKAYGDGSLWPLIEEANPDVDEAHLGPGQQIIIPELPPVDDEDESTP